MINSPDIHSIAALNDSLRKSFRSDGKQSIVALTPLVNNLFHQQEHAFFRAVADFDDFNEDNDPSGERCFGQIDYEGERYFFKIDYYARDLEQASPDPSDPEKTTRVMTIMHTSEY